MSFLLQDVIGESMDDRLQLSCPKNVLDKSAEDILPGDLFCNKIIPECTDSVSKTFPLSQLSTKINDC